MATRPYQREKTWVTGDIITADRLNDIEEILEDIDEEVVSARTAGSDSGSFGKRIDDLVIIQNTKPSSEYNKIWVKTTGNNIQVPAYTEFENLENRVKDLEYVPITISNFRITTPSNGITRMGNTVTSITFGWGTNITPLTLRLTGTGISGGIDITTTSTSRQITTSLTSNATYTLTATGPSSPSHSSGSSNSASCTIYFYNDIYWGATANTTVNSAFVRALSNNTLSNTKARSIDVTANSGQYIWYALPTRLGSCNFNVGGFDGGFEAPQTISVTNANNYTENYYVYRSTNAGLGSTTIKIS